MGIKCNIIYFTGTGNTRVIAEHYKSSLEKRRVITQLFPLENILRRGRLPKMDGGLTILGFPVHALNAPPNIFEFLHRLPQGNDHPIALFKNAGDPMKNGGFTWVRRILTKKGFNILHERSFVMPANTFLRYPRELEHALYKTSKIIAEKSVEEILNGVKRREKCGPVIDLAAKLFSTFEVKGAGRFGAKIKVNTSLCTGCGKCVDSCPVDNISMNSNKSPVWGNKCTLCMRCMYLCPQDAVRPGIIPFIRIKDGYASNDMRSGKPAPKRYRSRLFERIRKYTLRYL